jgi:protein involved in polysaccharide export with SLBB domain
MPIKVNPILDRCRSAKPLFRSAILALSFLGFLAPPGFAQLQNPSIPEPQARLQMAIASKDYPVSPGDRYQLSTFTGGAESLVFVTVESDYLLDLRALGVIDGRELTSLELRRQVDERAREAYPRSQTSFELVAAGVFQVEVGGAVAVPTRVTVWGLSRLSSVTDLFAEPYTSTRRVAVIDETGRETLYDIAAAQAGIEEAQNPLLRPGSVVRFRPVRQSVAIHGQVLRPGRYELLPNETARDLIELAGGLRPSADTDSIRLSRDGHSASGTYTFDLREASEHALRDGDSLSVGFTENRESVVFVEGAILATPGASELRDDSDDVELGYQRLRRPVVAGDTVLDVLGPLIDQIAPYADLENTVVTREGGLDSEVIDAVSILYGGVLKDNLVLKPFDTIFLPSRRVSVLLTGAVNNTGRVIYVPGQNAQFYIRQAGGVDPELNSDGAYTVYDQFGHQRTRNEVVRAGDTIDVHRNNFVYQFNRSFPIVVSSVGLLTSIVALFAALSQ